MSKIQSNLVLRNPRFKETLILQSNSVTKRILQVGINPNNERKLDLRGKRAKRKRPLKSGLSVSVFIFEVKCEHKMSIFFVWKEQNVIALVLPFRQFDF